MRAFLLVFLAVLTAFPAHAKSDACDKRFAKIFKPLPERKKPKKEMKRALKEVKENLGFKPKIISQRNRVEMRDPDGHQVGYVTYYLHKKDEVLEIDFVSVREDYRKNGVGEALFAQVLRQHPEIKEIETEVLVDTNEKVLKKALDAGLSCKDAIRATPAYRIRARFGFTELVRYECQEGEFVVRKKSD
jgi:GNAT superfamily N-acetyltransferase